MMSAAVSLARCISVPLMVFAFFCSRQPRSAGGGLQRQPGRQGCTDLGGLLLEVGLAGLVALVAAGHDRDEGGAMRRDGRLERRGWRKCGGVTDEGVEAGGLNHSLINASNGLEFRRPMTRMGWRGPNQVRISICGQTFLSAVQCLHHALREADFLLSGRG